MGKVMTVLSAAAMFAAVLVGTAAAQQAGTLTDGRDGQKYKTVKIGEQTWMAQNLNYQTESGSWCYKDSISYCKQYGRLYDWKTATTVCPKGWKLPSLKDWDRLVVTAGGKEIAGKTLKSKSGWNKNGNGTDDFGFSALPGGYCYGGRDFLNAGFYSRWWTAIEFDDKTCAYYRYMHYSIDSLRGLNDRKIYGFSARCVADNP
jgi:uncharacterized protein (TIGR02145 family)